MRILKFKSQLTIAFFAAVDHLNGPVTKQNFTLTGSKRQGLWFVIGGFRSVLCVSVFQGSLLVIVIMIDGGKKKQLWRRLLNFRVRMFVKSAVTKELNHCCCETCVFLQINIKACSPFYYRIEMTFRAVHWRSTGTISTGAKLVPRVLSYPSTERVGERTWERGSTGAGA